MRLRNRNATAWLVKDVVAARSVNNAELSVQKAYAHLNRL